MLTEFCAFIESIYGGSHRLEKNSMNHTMLIIENGRDKFKINLSDKERFGKYTLFHRDFGKKLDGRWCYHQQIVSRNLSFVIWIAYTHDFNKLSGIFDTRPDYERFFRDWKKSLILDKVEIQTLTFLSCDTQCHDGENSVVSQGSSSKAPPFRGTSVSGQHASLPSWKGGFKSRVSLHESSIGPDCNFSAIKQINSQIKI